MPIIYVRDKSTRKILYIEEGFSSLVWTERYQEAGDFVLDIPLKSANVNAYQRGNYISFDDSVESMIIESVEMTETAEEPTLEIKGRTLSSILSRRVNASRVFETFVSDISVWPDTAASTDESIEYSGSLSSVLQSIINDDVVNPYAPKYRWYHKGSTSTDDTSTWIPGYSWSIPKSDNQIRVVNIPDNNRKIPNLSFQSLLSSSENITINKKFSKIMTIYDVFVAIAKAYQIGFRSIFDENNNIVIQAFKGVDRTSNQKVMDPVIFNPVMDNISYVNYYEDSKEYKTTGFTYSDSGLNYRLKCGMELSGDSSRLYSGYIWNCGNDKTGMDRYEVPFDIRSDVSVESLAKNIDSEAVDPNPDDDTTEKYTRWVEYYHALENKIDLTGDDEFENGDYEIVKTSEGAIDPLVRYAFDKDYFIGDVVELSNDNGIIMTAYIDEVVRSYDEQGFITTPNFKNMTEYDYGEEEA